MKEQTNYDYEKYVQIAQMAKMGWWESDLKNKEYICSDFIVDLLGLESNRISFTEFHQRIREDHRLRLKNEGTDIHIYTGNPSVLGGISF